MHGRLELNQRGFALEATLLLLVLLAAVIGAASLGSVMVQRAAGSDYRSAKVTYAAEAGADHIMAVLRSDIQDGSISNSELAALTTPTMSGFTFTAGATRVGGTVVQTISTGPYTGLVGLNQRIDVSVAARSALNDLGEAVVSANAQSIPLFQFGVFYDEDLEITNGPPMTFAGWVHSNGKIYLSSRNQHFTDMITTPDSLIWQRKDQNLQFTGTWINDAAGDSVNLTFDSRNPGPSGFVAASQRDFDGRVRTGASGVTPLQLPLPAGMPATELIAPRNAGDSPQVQAVKLSWLADWHVTIDLSAGLGANVCGQLTALPRPGGRQVPSIAECQKMFLGRPNAFLEGREDTRPDIVEIDVDSLQSWVQASPGARQNSILYVTFTGTCPGGNTTCDYPAIRLVDGARLRFPWTIATDRPLYIWGDYNSNVAWQPAAILADAVTILSNPGLDWLDAGNTTPAQVSTVSSRPQVSRTVWIYAAIAAGHSSTPCDWADASCIPNFTPPNPPASPGTSNYGGGLENFPRFLENWGGSATGTLVHYRGSLVSLFESQYARLHRWGWRDYYVPPQRDWQFEMRFRDPAQLPPGTPTAGNVVQIAYRPVYR
jgi:Flp pilus assembly protein TadG